MSELQDLINKRLGVSRPPSDLTAPFESALEAARKSKGAVGTVRRKGDTVGGMRIAAAQSAAPIHFGTHLGLGVYDLTPAEYIPKYGSAGGAAAALAGLGYVAVVRTKGQKNIQSDHIHFADPLLNPKEAARLLKQRGVYKPAPQPTLAGLPSTVEQQGGTAGPRRPSGIQWELDRMAEEERARAHMQRINREPEKKSYLEMVWGGMAGAGGGMTADEAEAMQAIGRDVDRRWAQRVAQIMAKPESKRTTLDEYVIAINTGVRQVGQAIAAREYVAGLPVEDRLAEENRLSENVPQSELAKRLQERQQTRAERGMPWIAQLLLGFGDMVADPEDVGLQGNRLDTLVHYGIPEILTSAVSFAPGMAIGAATTLGVGLAAAPTVAGVALAPLAGAGASGAYAMDLEMGSRLMSELQKAEIDTTNPDDLRRARQTPEIWEPAYHTAWKGSMLIGIQEGAGAYAASGIGGAARKAIGKQVAKTGGRTAARVASQVGEKITETGLEMIGGAAGSIGADLIMGNPADWAAAAAEMRGELGSGPGQVAAIGASARSAIKAGAGLGDLSPMEQTYLTKYLNIRYEKLRTAAKQRKLSGAETNELDAIITYNTVDNPATARNFQNWMSAAKQVQQEYATPPTPAQQIQSVMAEAGRDPDVQQALDDLSVWSGQQGADSSQQGAAEQTADSRLQTAEQTVEIKPGETVTAGQAAGIRSAEQEMMQADFESHVPKVGGTYSIPDFGPVTVESIDGNTVTATASNGMRVRVGLEDFVRQESGAERGAVSSQPSAVSGEQTAGQAADGRPQTAEERYAAALAEVRQEMADARVADEAGEGAMGNAMRRRAAEILDDARPLLEQITDPETVKRLAVETAAAMGGRSEAPASVRERKGRWGQPIKERTVHDVITTDVIRSAFKGATVDPFEDEDGRHGWRVTLNNKQRSTWRIVWTPEIALDAAGQAQAAAEGIENPYAAGKWSVVDDAGAEIIGEAGLMQLAEGTPDRPGDTAVATTPRHESVHVARRLGLISENEWSTLLDHFGNEEGVAQAYEQRAEWDQIAPEPRNIFEKVARFFSDIYNRVFNNQEYRRQQAERFFGRMDTGEVWTREADLERGERLTAEEAERRSQEQSAVSSQQSAGSGERAAGRSQEPGARSQEAEEFDKPAERVYTASGLRVDGELPASYHSGINGEVSAEEVAPGPESISRLVEEQQPSSRHAILMRHVAPDPTIRGVDIYQGTIVAGNGRGRADVMVRTPNWDMKRFGTDRNDAAISRWIAIAESSSRSGKPLFVQAKGAKLDQMGIYSASTGCGRAAAILSAVRSGVAPKEALNYLMSCHMDACYVNFMKQAQNGNSMMSGFLIPARAELAGQPAKPAEPARPAVPATDGKRAQRAKPAKPAVPAVPGKPGPACEALIAFAARRGIKLKVSDIQKMPNGKETATLDRLRQLTLHASLEERLSWWPEIMDAGYAYNWIPQEAMAPHVVPAKKILKQLADRPDQELADYIRNTKGKFLRGNQDGDWMNELIPLDGEEEGVWPQFARAFYQRQESLIQKGLLKADDAKILTVVTTGWYVDVPTEILKKIADEFGHRVVVQVSGPIDFPPWEAKLRLKGFEKLWTAGFNRAVMRLITDEFGIGGTKMMNPESLRMTMKWILDAEKKGINLTECNFLETPIHFDDWLAFSLDSKGDTYLKATRYLSEKLQISLEEAAAMADRLVRWRIHYDTAPESVGLTWKTIREMRMPNGKRLLTEGEIRRLKEIFGSNQVPADHNKRPIMKWVKKGGGKPKVVGTEDVEMVFPWRCCSTHKCVSCFAGCNNAFQDVWAFNEEMALRRALVSARRMSASDAGALVHATGTAIELKDEGVDLGEVTGTEALNTPRSSLRGQGKRVGFDAYVPTAAIDQGRSILTEEEQAAVRSARERAGSVDSDLVNVGRKSVRFLGFNDIWDPHPVIAESTVVDRETGEVTSGRLANQIYHRLETMVDPSHPSWPMHRAITQYEEDRGLLRKGQRAGIGSRRVWNEWIGENMPLERYETDIAAIRDAYDPDREMLGTAQDGITSEKTSGNRLPATFSRVKWKAGTVNADIGGGRFDQATHYLREQGVENVIYDPFNRGPEHNSAAVDRLAEIDGADTVTVNNVLNVISDRAIQRQVIRQAAKAVKQGGTAYFLIYEDERNAEKGAGETSAGWQERRKTGNYVPDIELYFEDVNVKGNLITARGPIKDASMSAWKPEGAKSFFSVRGRGQGGRSGPVVPPTGPAPRLRTYPIEIPDHLKPAVDRLVQALRDAKPAWEITEEERHQERKQRTAKALGTKASIAKQGGTPSEQIHGILGSLKGSYFENPDFAPLGVDEQTIEDLRQVILDTGAIPETHVMTVAQANEALDRLIGGRVPTPSQQVLLARIFGPELIAEAQRAAGYTWADRIHAYFYGNMLSSPVTHIVNSISNALFAGGELAMRVPTGMVDAGITAGAKLLGKNRKRQRYASEVLPAAVGLMAGIPGGLRRAAHIMANGWDENAASNLDLTQEFGFVDSRWDPWRMIRRAMLAGDVIFKEMARESSLMAQGARKAIAAGRTGPGLVEAAARNRERADEAMLEEADRFAQYSTFQAEMGDFADLLIQARNIRLPASLRGIGGIQPVRLIVPFVQVGINMIKLAGKHSPLGLAPLAMPEIRQSPEVAAVVARSIVGSATMAGIAKLVAIGAIALTGAPPKEPDKRDLWHEEGKQPYAVKVGGKWYPYQRLGPIGYPLAVVAAFVDAARDDGNEGTTAQVMGALAAITKMTFDQSFFSGLNLFMEAAQELGGVASERLMTQIISQAIPLSAADRAVAKAFDPYVRDARGVYDRVRAQLPGISRTVPAKPGTLGKPLKRGSQRGVMALWPFSASYENTDPVVVELARLGVSPGYVSDKLSIDGKQIKLDRGQWRKYQLEAGSAEVEGDGYNLGIRELIASPDYIDADDDERRDMLESEIRATRGTVRDELKERLAVE